MKQTLVIVLFLCLVVTISGCVSPAGYGTYYGYPDWNENEFPDDDYYYPDGYYAPYDYYSPFGFYFEYPF